MLRRILFIGFAVLLSSAVVLVVHNWLGSRPTPRGDRGVTAQGGDAAMVRVLVAASDMPAGTLLRGANLRWQVWPAESAAPYVIEGHARISDYDGAVLRSRFAAGEPIVAGQVARPGERGFMAAVLAPGDSAVTIAVTPSTGMAGFVFPGDRIDLLLTMTVPSGPNTVSRRMSQTLLSDLRVVGVDQTLSDVKTSDKKDITIPKTVTIEVTPKQAEIVAVASELGILSLSLRSLPHASDESLAPSGGVTWDNEVTRLAAPRLSGGPRSPRIVLVHAAAPVRVFRGGETTEAAPPVTTPVEASHP